jgi:two-component system, sensor histidine kinase
MKGEYAAEIRDEQLKALFRQARVALLPNLAAAPAIAYVLWGQVPVAALLAWVAGVYAVSGSRATLVWLYGKRNLSFDENRRWGWALAAFNGLSGTMWGLAAFFFLGPASPLSQAFLIVTIAAMTAGAVSSLSAFLPAFVMFAVPCITLLIARALLEWRSGSGAESATWLFLAVLSAVFLAVHLLFGRNIERTLTESIRLRFEKLALVEQLTVQKERAEAASVAKSRFLAAASHDLRQPLHALGLFIEALRDEMHGQKAARLVESVVQSHDAATGLLDGLLEFSKMDAGVTRPESAVLPVQRLLDQMRAEFAVEASAADLELRIHPCRAFVRSDPALLARIIGNLVSNAIRYTDEGRIVVGCRVRGQQLRIEVHDTGIGIAEGEREAIFREFYQVEEGVRRRGRAGMGLGLAIVAGLARALGHEVTVASTPGKGSTFTVTVPLAQAPAQSTPAAPAPSDGLNGRVILVIDDEAGIRDAVAEVLLRWGCRALVAADADQAIAVIKGLARKPDAMIVDYQLERGECGLDALAQVEAAIGERIPSVVVSGDTRDERLLEAQEAGLLLLHKPLAPMRLRAALAGLLRLGSET